MFVCGISAFLIRIVPPREGVIVILSSVFNGVAVFGWNALDVISTSNIFPVHLRYVWCDTLCDMKWHDKNERIFVACIDFSDTQLPL